MKQPAAIVEDQRDHHARTVRAAQRSLTASQQQEAKASEQHNKARESLDDARQKTAHARMELGRALAAARKMFPRSGVNAKGWTEFLAEIGMDPDVADVAMKYAAHIDDDPAFSGTSEDAPEERRLPTLREAGLDSRPRASERTREDKRDDQDEEKPERSTTAATSRAIPMSETELLDALSIATPQIRARVIRATKIKMLDDGDKKRDGWCTSDKWAQAIGPIDLDPFCGPYSMIAAAIKCMRENDGDGFGGGQPGMIPGSYLVGTSLGCEAERGLATKETLVFLRPPSNLVLDAVAHYGHTRFVAVLPWAPYAEWFERLWPLCEVVCHPLERIGLMPPPDVSDPEFHDPHPHALFYRRASDVTDAVRELCIVITVDHGRSDPTRMQQTLRLVK